MKFFLICIVILISPCGFSQADIGGTGGGNGLPNLINVQTPVSGIIYSPTLGSQYAPFQADLQFLDQDNDNDITNIVPQWTGSNGITIDEVGTDLSTGEPDVQFHVLGPGMYTISCLVTYDEDGSQQSQNLTANCVAIGGVINFRTTGIGKEYKSTFSNDSGKAWYPWYIEYFGFTIKSGDPANNQNPQDLTCASATGQPTGTTYSWAIPSYTNSADLKGNPKEATISDLKATGPGINQAVVCTYEWSGTLNGAAITDWAVQDDTTVTPITGSNPVSTCQTK